MDFWGFMGGVVVNNEVELAVAVIGKLSISVQKGQEFLVAMALVASAKNSPRWPHHQAANRERVP